MKHPLHTTPFDVELSPGAYNAIHTCLRLQPDERITLITDDETKDISAVLLREIERVGSEYRVFVIEEYAQRPLKEMPQLILDSLAASRVSIYAVKPQRGELGSRIQVTAVVNRHRVRHAHMVGINARIMMEGMRADYHEVDRISQRLIERARKARRISVKSGAGTDLVAEFDSTLKWIKTSGIISEEKWGNLPGGEIFTAPENTNGVFVADGVIGDYLCQKYGDLAGTPLAIEIRDNRIVGLECAKRELRDEFAEYTSTDGNSNRVGEFAIGTNIAVRNIIGHILQDEKLPGVHIAFGHPYAEHTGQSWNSTTHIDCVGREFDIWMDGEQIMEGGKFLI